MASSSPPVTKITPFQTRKPVSVLIGHLLILNLIPIINIEANLVSITEKTWTVRPYYRTGFGLQKTQLQISFAHVDLIGEMVCTSHHQQHGKVHAYSTNYFSCLYPSSTSSISDGKEEERTTQRSTYIVSVQLHIELDSEEGENSGAISIWNICRLIWCVWEIER